MTTPDMRSAKNKNSRPGIFSLLKPYSGIVILLIIMALLGSSTNMLIPKIIAHGIDTFSAGHFDTRSVVILFMAAAAGIFIFSFLQNIFQTYASERVAKDMRSRLSAKISSQNLLISLDQTHQSY